METSTNRKRKEPPQQVGSGKEDNNPQQPPMRPKVTINSNNDSSGNPFASLAPAALQQPPTSQQRTTSHTFSAAAAPAPRFVFGPKSQHPAFGRASGTEYDDEANSRLLSSTNSSKRPRRACAGDESATAAAPAPAAAVPFAAAAASPPPFAVVAMPKSPPADTPDSDKKMPAQPTLDPDTSSLISIASASGSTLSAARPPLTPGRAPPVRQAGRPWTFQRVEEVQYTLGKSDWSAHKLVYQRTLSEEDSNELVRLVSQLPTGAFAFAGGLLFDVLLHKQDDDGNVRVFKIKTRTDNTIDQKQTVDAGIFVVNNPEVQAELLQEQFGAVAQQKRRGGARQPITFHSLVSIMIKSHCIQGFGTGNAVNVKERMKDLRENVFEQLYESEKAYLDSAPQRLAEVESQNLRLWESHTKQLENERARTQVDAARTQVDAARIQLDQEKERNTAAMVQSNLKLADGVLDLALDQSPPGSPAIFVVSANGNGGPPGLASLGQQQPPPPLPLPGGGVPSLAGFGQLPGQHPHPPFLFASSAPATPGSQLQQQQQAASFGATPTPTGQPPHQSSLYMSSAPPTPGSQLQQQQQQQQQPSSFGATFGGTTTVGLSAPATPGSQQQQQQPSPFGATFGGTTTVGLSAPATPGSQQQQQQPSPFGATFGGTTTVGLSTPSAATGVAQQQQQQQQQQQPSPFGASFGSQPGAATAGSTPSTATGVAQQQQQQQPFPFGASFGSQPGAAIAGSVAQQQARPNNDNNAMEQN